MNVKIAASWGKQLAQEFEQPYFKSLVAFVKQAYQHHKVYPPAKALFRAFALCSFEATKVVIIGQDPYHGPGQANGLCFSVSKNMPIPPSLGNIFSEIHRDVGVPIPTAGCLERWAKQGVLLLNAVLTVQANKPGSHQHKGWELFTDAVISKIVQKKTHVVFLLWGAYAQQKANCIDSPQHLVLKAAHPSPYAAANGFFGSGHFSKANNYLRATQQAPIQW